MCAVHVSRREAVSLCAEGVTMASVMEIVRIVDGLSEAKAMAESFMQVNAIGLNEKGKALKIVARLEEGIELLERIKGEVDG